MPQASRMASHPAGLLHGCCSLLTSRLECPRQSHQETWVESTGAGSTLLIVLCPLWVPRACSWEDHPGVASEESVTHADALTWASGCSDRIHSTMLEGNGLWHLLVGSTQHTLLSTVPWPWLLGRHSMFWGQHSSRVGKASIQKFLKSHLCTVRGWLWSIIREKK